MNAAELLQDMGVEFLSAGHHHCRPGWIQLDCPFCGKNSKGFHLGWNLASNYTNCWKCGGHRIEAVLREMGYGPEKAKAIKQELSLEPTIKVDKTRSTYKPPAGVGPLLKQHKQYLRSRDFDPEEMKQLWKIRGIGIAENLSWRVFLPVMLQGEPVSWTTRHVSHKAKQRYLSAAASQEKFNHKHLIYGQDYCSHSIVICEGPLDAWRIGPGAGALFGTAYSSAQVNRLLQHPCRYICFDSSSDAQRKAEELADQLSVFPGITENIVLDAADPGEASPREIRQLRRIAKL